MTVIAWDGKNLAADKRAENGGMRRTITKVHKVGKLLVALSGNHSHGLELLEWVKKGRVQEEYPEAQRNKDEWEVLVVVDHGELLVYERSPYPLRFEDDIYATGSGRDYALAAMHLGLNAMDAVRVASIFDIGCGDGVDYFEADDLPF